MARQIQLESQMKLRETGQPHLEAAAKDFDNLQTTINTLQSQVASLLITVTTLQATLARGASLSALVGNSTQTGTSTLDFTGGVLMKFTP
jgi:hypothetical protein